MDNMKEYNSIQEHPASAPKTIGSLRDHVAEHASRAAESVAGDRHNSHHDHYDNNRDEAWRQRFEHYY